MYPEGVPLNCHPPPMFAWFKRRTVPDHHLAIFAPDGSLTGVTPCSSSVLSPRWMDFWRQMLGAHGPVFKGAIPIPPLSHIEVRLTGTEGAALVGFTVQGQPVVSAVALTGRNPAAEADVLQMFVDSLCRTRPVRALASGEPPFQAVFGLAQRPLFVGVMWGNPAVDDEDHETVIELASHLAAVLLTGPQDGAADRST